MAAARWLTGCPAAPTLQPHGLRRTPRPVRLVYPNVRRHLHAVTMAMLLVMLSGCGSIAAPLRCERTSDKALRNAMYLGILLGRASRRAVRPLGSFTETSSGSDHRHAVTSPRRPIILKCALAVCRRRSAGNGEPGHGLRRATLGKYLGLRSSPDRRTYRTRGKTRAAQGFATSQRETD